MEPVKRLKRELAYKGAILEVYADTVQTKDGVVSRWDYIDHIGAAAVVPVLPDGRIVLVRQYRNALDRFTLELPAGKLEGCLHRGKENLAALQPVAPGICGAHDSSNALSDQEDIGIVAPFDVP